MKEFGPIPKDANCVGKFCYLCEKQIEGGDILFFLPIKPADEEEAEKMKAGRVYTTEAELAHKECKEKLDMFMQVYSKPDS